MARGLPQKGKSPSQRHRTVARGVYAPIAMLGTAIPVMAGMLVAERIRGRRTVGMTYIGDGGSSVGAFTRAQLRRRPEAALVLVVEHNAWRYSTPSEKRGRETLADKGPATGSRARSSTGTTSSPSSDRRPPRRRPRPPGATADPPRVQDLPAQGPRGARCPELRLAGELSEWKARDPVARFEPRPRRAAPLPPEAASRCARRSRPARRGLARPSFASTGGSHRLLRV